MFSFQLKSNNKKNRLEMKFTVETYRICSPKWKLELFIEADFSDRS